MTVNNTRLFILYALLSCLDGTSGPACSPCLALLSTTNSVLSPYPEIQIVYMAFLHTTLMSYLTSSAALGSSLIRARAPSLIVGNSFQVRRSVSRTIWDTINRAFSLSSAGTTYQGASPGACRTEAFLIRLHVVLPEFSLLDVRKAEFPVLFRLVDACEEALSLLFVREVEEELDDAGSVDMEMSLQIHDRPIPVAPDRLVVDAACPGALRRGEFRDARGRSALPRNRIG